jgi:hypothetical protein
MFVFVGQLTDELSEEERGVSVVMTTASTFYTKHPERERERCVCVCKCVWVCVSVCVSKVVGESKL